MKTLPGVGGTLGPKPSNKSITLELPAGDDVCTVGAEGNDNISSAPIGVFLS